MWVEASIVNAEWNDGNFFSVERESPRARFYHFCHVDKRFVQKKPIPASGVTTIEGRIMASLFWACSQ